MMLDVPPYSSSNNPGGGSAKSDYSSEKSGGNLRGDDPFSLFVCAFDKVAFKGLLICAI